MLIFQNWTYASYLVALKYIMKRLPYPVGIFFCGSAVGCAFLLLMGAPQLAQIEWSQVPREGTHSHSANSRARLSGTGVGRSSVAGGENRQSPRPLAAPPPPCQRDGARVYEQH